MSINPHILVFPYPAQGHMLALLDLTHQLALRGPTITILVTPKNLPLISSLLSSHPSSITPLVLPFPSHPRIPPGVEHVQDVGSTGIYPIMAALGELYDPLLSCSGSGSDPNDQVLTWLDRCPHGSVVYVCFGSQKLLRKEQMEGLAKGLEKSGTRFVWVVKQGTRQEQDDDGYGVIPDGFENRVAGRGLVIKGWASQLLILNHNAVGAFLSHCGWNSFLEGIVNGVMILAWPMEADQHVNARILVDDMGVAVRVCEGADSVPDSDELGRAIAESMTEGGRVKPRQRIYNRRLWQQ
ncbi:hypothetical protein PTKIN_Ptkin02bG0029000 [Pterospermum kingtungense]